MGPVASFAVPLALVGLLLAAPLLAPSVPATGSVSADVLRVGPRAVSPVSTWNFSTSNGASLGLVAMSGNGAYVVTATRGAPSEVFLFNGTSGAQLATWNVSLSPTLLTISSDPVGPGLSPLVLVGQGSSVEAYELGSPAFPSTLWSFTASAPSGWGDAALASLNLSENGSAVAVVTTFELTADSQPFYQLAYLSGGTGNPRWTVNSTTPSKVVGAAMTPDGSWITVATNANGNQGNAEVFSSSSIWWDNCTLPAAGVGSGAATSVALSSSGAELLLAGNGGLDVFSTATGTSLGDNATQEVAFARSVVSDGAGDRYVVTTGTDLVGFNTSAFPSPPTVENYITPLWEAPLSAPVGLVVVGASDPNRLTTVAGSGVDFYYVNGGATSYTTPYAVYAAPATPVAISASADGTHVALAFQYAAGQPELTVVTGAAPPPPPTFSVSASGATTDSFVVAWGLTGSSIPGFVAFTLTISAVGGSTVTESITSPSASTYTATGLSAGTTYTVLLGLSTFGGLFSTSASTSITTLPAPVPANPLVWAEIGYPVFLLAGAVGLVVLLLLGRSASKGPRPSRVKGEKGSSKHARKEKGSETAPEERHLPGQ